MLFEKTSWNPLIDGISDVVDQFLNSCLIFFLSSFDGFEEELDEAFKWILIHVIDDA